MWQAIKYGIRQMCSRPLYLLCMAGLPLLCCVLFVTMFWRGLPTQVPTAVVDLDHSSMSRSVVRALEANQFVNVWFFRVPLRVPRHTNVKIVTVRCADILDKVLGIGKPTFRGGPFLRFMRRIAA